MSSDLFDEASVVCEKLDMICQLICVIIHEQSVKNYCPFDISRKDVFCLAFYLN